MWQLRHLLANERSDFEIRWVPAVPSGIQHLSVSSQPQMVVNISIADWLVNLNLPLSYFLFYLIKIILVSSQGTVNIY